MRLKCRDLLNWLGFGQTRCRCCATPCQAEEFHGLCPQCLKALAPYAGPRCHLCGIPLEENEGKVCSRCSRQAPPWQGIAYYGLYESALRSLVLRLKFGSQLYLASLLAGFALDATSCLPFPDALTPIPQTRWRLWKRGFNQSHEIARRLAPGAGIRLEGSLLERTRSGPPQEELDAEARRMNMHRAFSGTSAARGKIIWLLDDVLTTGATCAAAATALLDAGARAVYVLAIARTPLK